MRINFRQGIVSHQPGGFLFVNGSGDVDALANNRPLTISVAEKGTNYTHSEDNTIVGAWSGPFIVGVDYWLYWDFSTLDFTRTFGTTTIEPIFQSTAPTAPAVGLIWYNTNTHEQFEYTNGGFVKVFRVLAARLINSTFFSMSQNAPIFTGTQIGDNNSARSGRILITEFGKTLRRDDATFFTTEDQFFTNQSQVAALRLEANVTRAKSIDPALAQFTIVAFSDDGIIKTAQYDDTGSTILAVLTEDLILNEVGSVIIQGSVTNPSWDFSVPGVGTTLWVANGLLVSTDPHISNVVTYPTPQVPVARVLSRDTIIFEQGLGGIGPKGPAGDINNLPPATTSTLGAALLSVPPTSPLFPVVVGDNDPRLSGGPFASLGHTHVGTDVSIVPSGGLSASNAQAIIDELEATKLALAGGTMTGTLFLNSDPSTAFAAATKQYVDGLVSGLLWLDPACLVNLIADDINDPTPLTPETGDAYILNGAGAGDWAGFNSGDIARWSGASWENGGQNNLTNFPTQRFMISAKSTTVASGSFLGQDNNIAIYDGIGGLVGFEIPVNNNAIFICNAFSSNAFNQYAFNAATNDWVLFGGGVALTPDNLTISQVGNLLQTIDFIDGGLVDATTYRGQDLDTVYTQIGHTHAASTVTLVAPYIGIDFGTPAAVGAGQLVATTSQNAFIEMFDKKANKEPTYVNFIDLPTASNVPGMIAEVLVDGVMYLSRAGAWIAISVNDGTPQGHEHAVPYDISFSVAGPAAVFQDSIIGSFIVPRAMTMVQNGLLALWAYAETAPAVNVDFDLQLNGVSFGTVSFLAGINTPAATPFPPSAQAFNAGDIIQLISPSVSDGDIADLTITVVTCATLGTCPGVI
jgi:hypothetical protein